MDNEALRERLQKLANDLDALRSTMPRQALEATDFLRHKLQEIILDAERLDAQSAPAERDGS